MPFVAPKRDRNHVRFGSKADIEAYSCDVRFTPKSRHWNSVARCPLCAKSGHYDCHAPIISSALRISVCGKVTLSAFAVLRLRTSLNLVGCSTGRSAGFAPSGLRRQHTPAARGCWHLSHRSHTQGVLCCSSPRVGIGPGCMAAGCYRPRAIASGLRGLAVVRKNPSQNRLHGPCEISTF